ncbi:MAG: preprotein translocase subunit Sec61beta [Candidatus Lokiarchaeota archaeon]|nr:preprotein translocase subunit Sec61beta [Candidatus Lokiarchaeota archaeon]
MSRRRKRKKKSSRSSRGRQSDGPMPFAGAGLIRFFQDESSGIKVSPVATLIISLVLLIGVGVANLFL